MINFDVEIPTRSVHTTIPTVRDSITVRRTPELRTTDAGIPSAQWTWEQLRDFVVREIERCSGLFPRDPLKETGIFKGFCHRWGDQAGPIAQMAFSPTGFNGIWKGAPISVARFCKNSDPYFAAQLANRLTH